MRVDIETEEKLINLSVLAFAINGKWEEERRVVDEPPIVMNMKIRSNTRFELAPHLIALPCVFNTSYYPSTHSAYLSLDYRTEENRGRIYDGMFKVIPNIKRGRAWIGDLPNIPRILPNIPRIYRSCLEGIPFALVEALVDEIRKGFEERKHAVNATTYQ